MKRDYQNLTLNEYDELSKRVVATICQTIMHRGILKDEGKTYRCHAVPSNEYLSAVDNVFSTDKKHKLFYARLFDMVDSGKINVDAFLQEFVFYHIVQRQTERGIKVDLDACKRLHLELSEDPSKNKRMLDILVYGNNNIVESVDSDARLHGEVNTISCETYKCSYSKPAVNTIPKQYRNIFVADKDYVLIKADAKQLHAVILAQYLLGLGCDELAQDLASDLHSANMRRFNVDTRDKAKKEFYKRLYSCPQTLNISGLKQLVANLQETLTKRDYIKALDGRIVYVDDSAKALVYLLSSADAILMKRVVIELDMLLVEKGYKSSIKNKAKPDYEFVMNVHDEIVIECLEVYAQDIAIHVKEAFKRASDFFKMQIKLECDMSVCKSL